ncbi:hypothetical protein KY312_02085 [Candidatus Woesearchaeota archaeon]|nr:hypothetical protein [Candidatus Woesearchaeota archaeon]
MAKKEVTKKIIYKLCWKHKRCSQAVFDMGYPLCNCKKCLMANYKSMVFAYKKSLETGE